MEGTFLALLPTLVAVAVAIISRQVVLSLFSGVFVGTMLISRGDPIGALRKMFEIMSSQMGADIGVSDGEKVLLGLGNAGIFIFIAELGILVVLMDRSGGTTAFGAKLAARVRSERGALLTAAGLGCLIFADDYFNRLAVGTIMRPIADKLAISREKLAYVVCGVSVSVCILVPVSSWAGAITGNIAEGMSDGDAFGIYLSTLSCNFYPILTLALLFLSPIIGIDLSKFGSETHPAREICPEARNVPKGRPVYLLLPVFTLIISSTVMLTATSLGSITSLVLSGALALAIGAILCLVGKAIKPREIGSIVSDGLASVGDVLIILILAQTLTGVCAELGMGEFIGGITAQMGKFRALLPAIMFALAMGTSLATGTAWGTFGILVPLSVPMFNAGTMQILTIAAVLSGAVFGNQVSPISDSTMLASKVCECDHMSYIKAQIIAALPIALCALGGFVAAGLASSVAIGWLVSGIMFVAVIVTAKLLQRQRRTAKNCLKARAQKTVRHSKKAN